MSRLFTYRHILEHSSYLSTWLPVAYTYSFGLQHRTPYCTMEGKSDSSTGNPPEVESTGVKRPAESESEEAQVKRIQLNPIPEETDTVRRKRKKFAVLLSYSGKGYIGMQRNHGFKTIEGDLLNAMVEANLMSEEGIQVPQLFQFQRAARTDKGVSAARQVVSVKLPDDVPDIASEINKRLCDQIRVMAVRRTTKGFNSKTWCDCRTYSYMCPTYAFAPVEEVTREEYRIAPEVLEQLRSTLKLYKGTHNFHNFTARKKFQEDSAKRYIIDIDCSDPFEREGLEWVIIKIKGQSFMLHQIRKMVGLAIAVLKGLASPDVINKAWGKDRVDVPIAPSLGLVLEEPHYDKYNLRYGSDGIHEKLSFDDVKDQLQTFREEFIDSTIINEEKEGKSMLKWLATLPLHTFDVRDIPDDDQSDSVKYRSQTRSAIGRAAVRLKREQDNSDEDEVVDDEGDLDQYRIKPVPKEEHNEGKSSSSNLSSNNSSEGGVNGMDKKDTIQVEKVVDNVNGEDKA